MRLYKAEWVDAPPEYEDHPEITYTDGEPVNAEPDGWREHCVEVWGEWREFFWPSTSRIYRSRSAAQSRVDLINRWGGVAVVVETDTNWRTLAAAKNERAQTVNARRIAKLQAQIDALTG